ncbi:MAG: hypothetical protein PHH82_03520 [Candidatus ainarchaeum sp.]|nr:hypothetical protein [Candidatus ainarchaeum sp.]
MDYKQIFMYFVILNIFFSAIAFSYVPPSDYMGQNSCKTERLSPEEINILWDEYLRTGFTPNQIISGTPEELKNSEKTVEKKDFNKDATFTSIVDDKAITADVRTDQKIPYNSYIFNKVIDGDYAYGVFLNDSLRIGRCKDGTIGCAVTSDNNGLYLRNSDGAIKTFTEGVKSFFTGDEIKQKDAYGAGVVNQEEIKDKVDLSQADAQQDINVVKFTHELQEKPMSSFLVDDFSSEFMMLCNNQDSDSRCRVLLYSFFDKRYNAYYSGSLISIAGGPIAWGAVSKVFGGFASFKYGAMVTKAVKKVTDPAKQLLKDTWYKLIAKDFGYFSKNVGDTVLKATQKGGIGGSLKVLGDNAYEIVPAKLVAAIQKDMVPGLTTAQAKEAIGDVVVARASAADYGRGFLESVSGESDVFIKRAAAIEAADKAPVLLGAQMNDTFLNENFAGWVVDTAGGSVAAMKPITKFDIAPKFLKGEIDPSKIYKLAAGGTAAEGVALSDLKNFLKSNPSEEYLVEIAGTSVPLNASTVDAVKDAAAKEGIGSLSILTASRTPIDFGKFGGYEGFKQKFAKDYYDFVKYKYTTAANNYDTIMNTLQGAKAMPTRNANAMNFFMKLWAGKGSAIGGLVRLEAIPTMYWMAKTGEFGDTFKAYMIKEQDLTTIKTYTGADSLYNSAYMDIFSREGSNNGDMFSKVIDYIVFIDNIGLLSNEMEQSIKSFFSHQFRDEPEDLVFYNEALKCGKGACTISLNKQAAKEKIENTDVVSGKDVDIINDKIHVNTQSLQGTKNYVVEFPDPVPSDDPDPGYTLSAFVHRMNIVGKDGEINLASALAQKEDCVSKAKGLTIVGIPFGSMFASDVDPSKFAIPLGIVDNSIGLALTGIPGLALSVVSSILIMEQVQEQVGNCVDIVDGYYVTDSLIPYQDMNDSLMSKIGGVASKGEKETEKSLLEGTPLDKIATTIKDQFNKIISNKTHEAIQINVETKGKTNGSVYAEDIFLIWEGGNASQINLKYDDKSYTTLKDKDGKTAIIDNEKGIFEINGKQINNPDLVRLMKRNNRGPFYSMPVAVTVFSANSVGNMFEAHTNGDFLVKDPSILDCIRAGVFEQTGMTMMGNSLYEHMGPVTEILVESGTIIRPSLYGSENQFSMEGTTIGRIPMPNSTLTVKGDRTVVIKNAQKSYELDGVVGIAFEKGSIVYKAQTNEFIMWIENMAQIDGKYISNLMSNHNPQINEETGCEEDAFDLKLAPIPGDVTAEEEVGKMNIALEKAGPFQYFQTPKYNIIFYSKMESGVCKKYMKVVDRETGRVISDAEVTSVTKTPDGYKVTTADGKTHDIGFEVANGKPILSYNGDKQPLLIAQGKDGAFYYDPSTGKWYVDNAQVLPIDDDFKLHGSATQGNNTYPSDNPISGALSPSDSSKSSWDIPLTGSLLASGLVMLVSSMFVYLYFKREDE